jgi:hypothetical protein
VQFGATQTGLQCIFFYVELLVENHFFGFDTARYEIAEILLQAFRRTFAIHIFFIKLAPLKTHVFGTFQIAHPTAVGGIQACTVSLV